MTIGAECGKRGKIIVNLARAPAVPIAAKAGAEKQNVFHRIFGFWERYHAGWWVRLSEFSILVVGTTSIILSLLVHSRGKDSLHDSPWREMDPNC